MNLEIKLRHIFWLIILSMTWGANYLFVKIAVVGLDPLMMTVIRGISASSFMIPALLLMKKPFWKYFTHLKMQLTSLTCGSLIAFMWYTMAKAETQLSSSMTALLIALLPIFSWIIAIFIYREKPFLHINLLGIFIALIGTLIMLDISKVLSGHMDLFYALFYILGLAAFSVGAALSAHDCRHIDAFITVTFNIVYATLVLILVMLLFGASLHSMYSMTNISAACATGVISTGIGYLIYFWLIAHTGQVFAASSAYLAPISGFILSILFLQEHGHLYQIIGLLVIFAGIYLINKKSTKEHLCQKIV